MKSKTMSRLNNYKEIPTKTLISMLYNMLLIRKFEEKIVGLYPEQDIKTPVHLYIGQEAIATGVCTNLNTEDFIFTTHRNHGHCLAKGVDPKFLFAEFYGKETGCCKGKGGSMHPAIPELGIHGTSAIVGGGMPIAVGAALAFSMKGENRVSLVFFGDGAADQGVFHESLNFASLKKLPVVFICENNFYATNSHLSARQPHLKIAKRAEGYNIPGIELNGNDVVEIYKASKEAVQKAKNHKGPTLIECKTYRWKGHVGPEYDYKNGCRPKEELESWMAKCPIKRHKEFLFEKNILDESELQLMNDTIDNKLESALQYAKESKFPPEKELYTDVYYGGE